MIKYKWEKEIDILRRKIFNTCWCIQTKEAYDIIDKLEKLLISYQK